MELPMLGVLFVATFAAGLSAQNCGHSTVQLSRIVHGKNAVEGAWPWIGSLQYKYKHTCGAVLISPTWVLTAGHCVDDIKGKKKRFWYVKLGAHDHSKGSREKNAQNLRVKKVVRHENYNTDNNYNNDIALLQLAKPAQLNSRVAIACLPEMWDKVRVGTKNCYLAGWGRTNDGQTATILQQTPLPVVETHNCIYRHDNICTGFGVVGKGNGCKGDSGGPFMCQEEDGRWTTHGVTSYVINKECEKYTSFTGIYRYINWIKENMH